MNLYTKNRIHRTHKHAIMSLASVCGVLAFILVLIAPVTNAAPNYQMNYQGKLTNASNIAVADGTYNMRFWLLTSPSIATTSAVWTESLTTTNKVQVTNGLFSVMLGSTSPLTGVDFNQTLYLGVEIGGTSTPAWDGEMSPRKVLGTVPAAFEANKLDGLDSTQFVRTDATSTIATSSANTLLTLTQSGAGDIFNLFDGTTEVFTMTDGGRMGLGTTSPSRLFTMQGGDFWLGGNMTATGTLTVSGLSTLGDFVATNGTTTNATSTNLRVSGLFTLGGDALTDLTGSGLKNTTNALTCETASGSLFGCLTSADWTTFMGKVASSSIDTSSELATLVTDETGSGSLVFSGSPIFTGGAQFAGIRASASSTLGYASSTALTVSGNTYLGSTAGILTTNATGLVTASTTVGDAYVSDTLTISGGVLGSNTITPGSTWSNSGTLTIGGALALTSYTATNGTTTNASSTNLFSTNARFTNVIGTNGLLTNATTTNASSTNLFATNGRFTNAIIGAAAGVLTTNATGLVSASTTIGSAYLDSAILLSSELSNSSQLAGLLSDETGAGNVVFSGSPIFTGGAQFAGIRASASSTLGYASSTALTVTGNTFLANLLATGSSTIGGGTGATGLTINGGATTTGNAYFAGNVGIGSTSPNYKLDVNGTVNATAVLVNGVPVGTGSGSVSSVDMSVPTGFSISGNPITTSGTLALTYAAGYEGLRTASSTNWNTFYNTPSNRITDGTGLTWSTNTLNCDTANGSTQGCITGADWQSFNDKVSSTSINSEAELETLTGVDIVTVTTNDITSANLANILTDETGTGFAVFSNAPTFTGTTAFNALTVSATSTLGFASSTALTVSGNTYLNTFTANSGTTTNASSTNLFAINGRFTNSTLGNATGTALYATTLGINSEYFTDLTGSGLKNTANVLTCETASGSLFGCLTSADWTTFMGKVASSSIDSSAELAALVTDETGTGSLVFSGSPVFTGTAQFAGITASASSTLGFASSTALTVSGNTYLNTFTANSGTTTNASSTNLFATNGRFTNATIGSAAGILTTDATGLVTASTTIGDAYISDALTIGTGSSINFTNATESGLLSGISGIIATGSSTIGGGTGATGLTINGGATTTGNMYIAGNVGIGTTTPAQKLSIAGGMHLTGALYDSTYNPGTNGMVLQTTSTGVQWVATSTLGFSGGASTFLSLTDTPSSFTANRIPYTNSGATALIDSANFTFDGSLLTVTGGLRATASSTIGDGTGAGGLTIYGGATSTGRFVIGTNPNTDIFVNSGSTTLTASNNVAIGNQSLTHFGPGAIYNIGLGYQALYGSSTVPMTGNYNFAAGRQALYSNTSGAYNNALGNIALTSNTGGMYNNAFGSETLSGNTTGSYNNAFGAQALDTNITGNQNNALGRGSLQFNQTGSDNNALGFFALRQNTTGIDNNAFGQNALQNNKRGSYNTGIGYSAGNSIGTLATSSFNTYIGYQAGFGQTQGDYNLVLGTNAGYSLGTATSTTMLGAMTNTILANISTSTALGAGALLARSNTMVLGGTGSNAVDIVTGTSTPWAKLSIMNNYGATTPLFDVATTTSSAYATSSLFRITADGNIGIGTTTPSSRLTIAGGNAWIGGNLTATGTATFANLLVTGSSTIGGGTGATGLTISGGATTTGNGYVAGRFEIGPKVSNISALSVVGNVSSDDDFVVLQNTNNGGFSAAIFQSDSESIVGSVGYGNTGAPIAADSVFLMSFGKPIVLSTDGATPLMMLTASQNVGIGTSTPTSRLTMDKSGFTGSGVAGIKQYLGFTNSTLNALYYGDETYITNVPTATSTLVGKMIRIADTSALGNTIRGLEVQAHRGTNTKGENTGLSGFGRTFGVRGSTMGDAGSTYLPAGIFAESEGTTQGNALRAYSGTMTTESLVYLFQDTSNFTGTGLKMDFGNAGGSFAATSSAKFADFKVSGTSKFTIAANGSTTIGDGTVSAGLRIPYGGICVDNDGSCVSTTTGQIRSVTSALGNSDLAEMYFSRESLKTGEIVSLSGGLSVKRANGDTEENIIGVVSTKPGMTLGFDDSSLALGETGYPVGLKGRVPIRLSTENGPIMKGDRIALSSIPGVGMKATESSRVVGIALEDYDGAKAYSAGFLNQFGDDMLKERVTVKTVLDPKSQDGCYNGGGNALGEAVCVAQAVTNTTVISENPEETRASMLAELRNMPPETMTGGDGETYAVGQAIMFIELTWYQVDHERMVLSELATTSSLFEGSETTLWDSIKALASSFVDGVLSVTGIKADRVEVKNELCVDGVCVTADDLRAILQSTRGGGTGGDTGGGEATGGGSSTGGEGSTGGAETPVEPAPPTPPEPTPAPTEEPPVVEEPAPEVPATPEAPAPEPQPEPSPAPSEPTV